MRINNNLMAINAHRNLGASASSMAKAIEKLSSGLRINRAADDASGLVISQKLRAQTSGLRQATRNAQDGISVVQVAEGALTEVHTMLNRMRDLAVQSANTGVNDATAQAAAQAELVQLRSEIDRIGNTTSFGDNALLDGTYSGIFQVGANNTADDQISVAIAAVSSTSLGIDALDLTAAPGAAIDAIDTAIASVSTVRSDLGAIQNRLESTISNLQVTTENLAASESRIRDTDVAAEMMEFTRAQILQQAGTAMLGQANVVPQSVLRLLG